MARKIGVSFGKGGTGKTNTALAIGSYLSRKGKRVLIVDTDHASNVRRYLNANPAEGLTDLANKFLNTQPTSREVLDYCEPIDNHDNLFILATQGAIDRLETNQTYSISFTGDRWEQKKMGVELQLKKLLASIETEFDYIFVDNPPSIEETVDTNVFFYVDELIVPLQLESSSMELLRDNYLTKYSEIIALQREVRSEDRLLKLSYIVPTFYIRRNILAKETLYDVHKYVEVLNAEAEMNIKVTHPVSRSTLIGQAVKKKISIFDYAPNSIVAQDYAKVAEEILNDE